MTKIIALFILASSLLFVINCGSKKIPKGMSDEELYNAAMEEMTEDKGGFPWIFRGRDYDSISAYLKEVQLRYTYSPYSALSELRTGDLFYQRGEYEQAALEYEEFLKRHPGHKEADYATYRVALSYYREIKSPDRDPSSTRQSLLWFNVFVDKYPDSPLVPDAMEKIIKCKDVLARREIYIGNFYSRRKNYRAAADRYKIVVDDFYDTEKYEEALYLLGRAYVRSDQYELARVTLNELVEQFPNDKYYNKASSLLNEIQGKTAPPPDGNGEGAEQPQQG